MIRYVCKYTPVELLRGFGAECAVLDEAPESLELGERASHPNLCGFGKAVLQAALAGRADELVLVNCCDVMRRIYDVLIQKGCCRFVYLLDLPHTDNDCQRRRFAREIQKLGDAYAATSGQTFDRARFLAAFETPCHGAEPYIALLGARAGSALENRLSAALDAPVRNLTCVGSRAVSPAGLSGAEGDALMAAYAGALLSQLPCRRMEDHAARRALFEDPALLGVVYHTIKFCDYYGLEYAAAQKLCAAPMTRIETDGSAQSEGQLSTRIEAFAETLGRRRAAPAPASGDYFAGVDSGSASTDAVIIDRQGQLLGSSILPTGGGARKSAALALDAALLDAGLARSKIARVVATGYGRENIGGGESVTEISCHARGAHFLRPGVRTVIDIGGQDSKIIRLDGDGRVLSFAMNDKCAAGTGRFLEMMARTLGLTLEEMSRAGLEWREDLTISSTCTVFAESEVVSLVARNVPTPDIVHGLNKAVAAKVAALLGRLGGEGEYMMTGGVAQNEGVARAIEARLGEKITVCPEAQLCGALGAALFAAGLAEKSSIDKEPQIPRKLK